MKKTIISASIEAHSINPVDGSELISAFLTAPRIILAELNTHRMLSKNTSSSRAIPFHKMVETVTNDPFIPIAFQKKHSGMQGKDYIKDPVAIQRRIDQWLYARDLAVLSAKKLYEPLSHDERLSDLAAFWEDEESVTKQICNRLLEPFMWFTALVTGSREGWDNFFNLRSPNYVLNDDVNNYSFKSKSEIINHFGENEQAYVNDSDTLPLSKMKYLDWSYFNYGQAEIHIMELAEQMYDQLGSSTPEILKSGEYHIPFKNKILPLLDDYELIDTMLADILKHSECLPNTPLETLLMIKISTSMGARTSYTIVGDEKEIDIKKLVSLHNQLIESSPRHSSPLEHIGVAMSELDILTSVSSGYSSKKGLGQNSYGWCNNFRGFKQYRYLVDNAVNNQ